MRGGCGGRKCITVGQQECKAVLKLCRNVRWTHWPRAKHTHHGLSYIGVRSSIGNISGARGRAGTVLGAAVVSIPARSWRCAAQYVTTTWRRATVSIARGTTMASIGASREASIAACLQACRGRAAHRPLMCGTPLDAPCDGDDDSHLNRIAPTTYAREMAVSRRHPPWLPCDASREASLAACL